MNIYPFLSNRARDVWAIFLRELRSLYSEEELRVLFRRILEHFGYQSNIDNVYFNQSELIDISGFIDELKQNKPIAYILGYTYFYHLKFLVNPHVLIPRPETEELVWQVKQKIEQKFGKNSYLKIIDIGTGSGCIAITLKHSLPRADVWATDISEKALELAHRNSLLNKTDVFFLQMDVFQKNIPVCADIIVSNPPYIPWSDADQVEDRVKKFEPLVALFSDTAMDFYECLFALCENCLNTNGLIFLEINPYYASDILQLAQSYKYLSDTKIIKDWSGNDRFFYAEKRSV